LAVCVPATGLTTVKSCTRAFISFASFVTASKIAFDSVEPSIVVRMVLIDLPTHPEEEVAD
jgi:hypothetical protein